MAQIRSKNPEKDAAIQTLNEHEHSIDCIKWAPPEACKIIDQADYNKSSLGLIGDSSNIQYQQEVNGNE